MKPCKRGHTGGRNKRGDCIECRRACDAAYRAAHREEARAYGAAHRAAHRDEERARNAAYDAAHREERAAYSAAYYAANREEKRAYGAAYYAANRDEERARIAAWRKAHPEKPRAHNSKRRSMKLAQRCVCCTDAQIELLYLAAKPWGVHAEVDHRVPLALGGRHCAKNLVLLPTVAHAQKTKHDVRAIAEARRRSRLLQRWAA